MKNRIFALLCAVLLALSCTACAAKPEKQTCTLTVSCAALTKDLSRLSADKAALTLPSDGQIIPTQAVEFEAGQSALDVLKLTAEKNNIPLDIENGEYVYVNAIGGLAGLDAGDLSGWMFSRNGEFPEESCAAVTVEPGDEIAFLYTCDMGADLGIVW